MRFMHEGHGLKACGVRVGSLGVRDSGPRGTSGWFLPDCVCICSSFFWGAFLWQVVGSVWVVVIWAAQLYAFYAGLMHLESRGFDGSRVQSQPIAGSGGDTAYYTGV